MFCGEIRIKQGISYITFYPLRILYNSKFILMATSLGTNAVVVTWVHCIYSAHVEIAVAMLSACRKTLKGQPVLSSMNIVLLFFF